MTVGLLEPPTGGFPGGGRMLRTSDPGIYRRGRRFVVVWRHNGRQVKKSFATLEAARAARARHRAGDTRPKDHSSQSFRSYALTWLDEYEGTTSRGISPTTRRDYAFSIRTYAVPFLGSIRLCDLRARDLRDLIRHLERRGLRPSTIRKHMAPISAMLKRALEDHLIDRNPAAYVRVPEQRRDLPSEPRYPRALSRDEIRALLDAVDPQWRLLLELLLHTGLRISEAIALTWGDTESGPKPCIHVRRQVYEGSVRPPKTVNGVRTIPLSPRMSARLADRRDKAADPSDEGLVFPSSTGGYLEARNMRNRILRPAFRKAGLPPGGFHLLRHTFASMCFAPAERGGGGKTIAEVSAALGHADPVYSLRTYIHLVDRDIGKVDFFDPYTTPNLQLWGSDDIGCSGPGTDAGPGPVSAPDSHSEGRCDWPTGGLDAGHPSDPG